MRKLLSTFMVAVMVLSSASVAFAGVGVSINNKPVQFSEQSGSPFVDGSYRTQVPFRATMEAFGATVDWDNTNRIAIAEKDGVKVEVPIGQKYIFKNGTRIDNDTAALVKDGRTYLPIRVVLEAFGARVDWDAGNQTVLAFTDSILGETMTIHFIDVGQGDSIFIDYNDFEVLIDAGPRSAGSTVANYIRPYVDGNLDIVVATHEHEDHIGGLPTVLSTYTVDKIIDNGRNATTRIYSDYIAAVQAQNAEYLTPKDAQTFSFFIGDNASYRILQMSGSYSDPNNNSLVSLLSYGDVQVLFMGDAEQAVEKANLNKFSDIEILKAGHHGSGTSSSTEFLSVTKPETVIISAATGNTYRHPHLAAMQRFSKVGAKTYGTFKSGSIVATTNGSSYSLNTSAALVDTDAGDYSSNSQNAPVQPNIPSANNNNNAVTQSEAKYVGNSNTKKFHAPTCRYVKTIKNEHLMYFKTAPQGYGACKVCNPR